MIVIVQKKIKANIKPSTFIYTYLDVSNKIHFNWSEHGGAQLVYGERGPSQFMLLVNSITILYLLNVQKKSQYNGHTGGK